MANNGEWFALNNICGWCKFVNDGSVSTLKFCSDCGKPLQSQANNSNDKPKIVEIVEEPVLLKSLSQKGSGTFCIFDIAGDRGANDDIPQINIDDNTGFTKGTMAFTFTPGRLNFSVECIVEGGKIVKKYSIPFEVGCERLKRVGNTIEINPF